MKVEKIFLDTETPISIFLKLEKVGFEPKYLLESSEDFEKWGRYSFLGFGKPKAKILYTIPDKFDRQLEYKKLIDDFTTIMASIMENYSGVFELMKNEFGIKRIPLGLVGYVSYDMFSIFEKVDTKEGKESFGIPDLYLVFSPNVLIFDNLKKEVIILADDVTSKEIVQVCKRSIDAVKVEPKKRRKAKVVIDKTQKAEFEDMVEKARRRIYEGDAIQVVISRAKEIMGKIDIFALYRILRVLNPSPYMFFLNFDDVKIAGTSPEVLVRVEDKKVETKPIAGTRRRGETPEEDRRLEQELLSDEKELAEHLMLVDLARNDLGKVCKAGTVKVKRYGYIEKYSRVMHIVSEVEGESDRSPIEILSSCFPAGTVVGAPKIESAKIIAELEKERRGPYAGAVGYFSADGNMDSAITIRTAFCFSEKIRIQAGAGIVYYSVPEREYFETEAKMKAIEDAIEKLS